MPETEERVYMVGNCPGCGQTYSERELARGEKTPCCWAELEIWGTEEDAENLEPEDEE